MESIQDNGFVGPRKGSAERLILIAVGGVGGLWCASGNPRGGLASSCGGGCASNLASELITRRIKHFVFSQEYHRVIDR